MAPQTIFVLDQGAKDEIALLHHKIDRLTALLSSQTPGVVENPWHTSTEFCRKYSMSRSTLARRVKDDPSPVEVLDTGGKRSLYRWKEEEEQ
ncbi:MAG: hypothetical protein ACOYJV_01580 [Aminivibrio sp.]|jgi:hypothetical protein